MQERYRRCLKKTRATVYIVGSELKECLSFRRNWVPPPPPPLASGWPPPPRTQVEGGDILARQLSSDHCRTRQWSKICQVAIQRVVIIENKAFSLSYDLAPSPLLAHQQVVYLSQPFSVSPVELTDGKGGGRGRSQIIRRRESLVLYFILSEYPFESPGKWRRISFHTFSNHISIYRAK